MRCRLEGERVTVDELRGIPELPDPVALLHRRVASTSCVIVAPDGWPFSTLFGTFSVQQGR
jgi:hypothetical protein